MPKNSSKSTSSDTDFQESKAKIFDKQLYKELFRYAKPYKIHLILIILVVLVTVVAEMSLPLITRHIIDGFINPRYKIINISTQIELKERLVESKELLINLDENSYLINEKDEKKLNVELLRTLKKSGLISTDNFYFARSYNIPDSTKKELKKSNLDFSFYPSGVVIPNSQLSKLDKATLKAFRGFDLKEISYYSIYFLLILIISFLLSYLQVYIITLIGQKIMYDIRLDLFARLEKMPLKFFDKNPVGVLVTRVTNDINNLEEFFSVVLVSLFKDIFILAAVIGILLTVDFELSLISFTIIPLIIITTIYFKKKMRVAYRLVRNAIAKINASLSENISGMNIIQLFNRQKESYKTFQADNHELYQSSHHQMLLNAWFNPIMSLIRYCAIALVLYFGSTFIMATKISVGTMVAFLAYVEKFFEPIQDISEKVTQIQSALASSERIFALLEAPIEEDSGKLKDFVRAESKIEFKNVWFAYNEPTWILKDFSLTINPGEKIALVGPTGAGKSSIINILNRFYPIQKGEILINGVNIYDLPLAVLRKHIGVVQQEIFLFAKTIRENIVLDRENVSEEELLSAAKESNAYHFIQKMEKGFETELKEGGVSISVGQRQLISFSRMLVYNPQILVLDEATSSIDTETELLIQDALNRLMINRTSIIIAHRLSTIQHCDKIVVIHKGEIKESGTHQELLEKKGIYHNLYLLQYKES